MGTVKNLNNFPFAAIIGQRVDYLKYVIEKLAV
jgi:hypothetical protein